MKKDTLVFKVLQALKSSETGVVDKLELMAELGLSSTQVENAIYHLKRKCVEPITYNKEKRAWEYHGIEKLVPTASPIVRGTGDMYDKKPSRQKVFFVGENSLGVPIFEYHGNLYLGHRVYEDD